MALTDTDEYQSLIKVTVPPPLSVALTNDLIYLQLQLVQFGSLLPQMQRLWVCKVLVC